MAFGDIHLHDHGLFHHFAFEGPMGRVIEYTKRYGPPRVMLTTVDELSKGGGARYWKPYPPDAVFTAEQAWRRLYDRLGEQLYSVTGNNCESLLNWAIYGRSHSAQGQNLAGAATVVVGVAALMLVAAALEG